MRNKGSNKTCDISPEDDMIFPYVACYLPIHTGEQENYHIIHQTAHMGMYDQ